MQGLSKLRNDCNGEKTLLKVVPVQIILITRILTLILSGILNSVEVNLDLFPGNYENNFHLN